MVNTFNETELKVKWRTGNTDSIGQIVKKKKGELKQIQLNILHP